MKINKLTILFACLILFSCKKNDSREISSNITIDIPENIDNTLFTEGLVDSIQYVPLETNQECLIGSIDQIYAIKDTFYIHSHQQQTIFIFTKEGKYVSKIQNRGDGPGEYIELRDFKVNESGDIYILDFNKIIKYNPKGEYLDDYKLDFDDIKKKNIYPTRFVMIDESLYLWRGSVGLSDRDVNKHHALYRIENKRIKSTHFLVSRMILGYFQQFYKSGDAYNIQAITGDNIVYKINKEGVHPNFKVNFGKRNIPENTLPEKIEGIGKLYYDIQEDHRYCIHINSIHETNDYIYFAFMNGGNEYQSLYNKTQKNVRVGKINSNNIASTAIICTTEDGAFVGKMEPMELKESTKNTLEVLFDDNPILILYYLK